MHTDFTWVLGIESSCDETAVALLKDGGELCANLVASQTEIHEVYGGVVPELASRQHMETINYLIDKALGGAGIDMTHIDGIAVSKGPGLVGALLVGVSTAKALAYSLGIPYVGVNHMEGHIYANWLAHGHQSHVGQEGDANLKIDVDRQSDTSLVPEFPMLGLIVSGGHTALMILEGHGRYRLLGQTRDDAAGEAYDKVARTLGLGYPGGPSIDELAVEGDPGAFAFPRAQLRDDPWSFSFSGVKTAVINLTSRLQLQGRTLDMEVKADIAASFQEAVTEALVAKTMAAASEYGLGRILLAGGVAANSALRRKMLQACDVAGLRLHIPQPAFCTDNAAMIACAGFHRLTAGFRDDLYLNAQPSLGMV